MINSCIVCLLLGIVVGALAIVLSKGNDNKLPINIRTNTGWNWRIWKTTIISGTLATLKKGNKDITIIADDDNIIVDVNGIQFSINDKYDK